LSQYSSSKAQYSGSEEEILSVRSVRLNGAWGFEVQLSFDNGDVTTVQVRDTQVRSPKLFEKAVLHQTGRPFSAAAVIGRQNSGCDRYLPNRW